METFFRIILIAYLGLSIAGYYMILMERDQWLPEFENRMKNSSFKVLVFIYSPIAIIQRIFNGVL